MELEYLTVGLAMRIVVALVLGLLIGVERTVAHKTAGMRTFAMVSMGSALFVVSSLLVSQMYFNQGLLSEINPLALAPQILVGIGFLGAGLIMVKGSDLVGLTTAASLWVSAGVGMACGFGLYVLAIFATLLTLFILAFLWKIEEMMRVKNENITQTNKD